MQRWGHKEKKIYVCFEKVFKFEGPSKFHFFDPCFLFLLPDLS